MKKIDLLMKVAVLVLCGIIFSGASASAAEYSDQTQAGSETAEQGVSRSPAAGGNRQPSAEEVREMMQGVMGPMMGEMMSSMLKAMTKTMAEPQIAQNMAVFARNYYKALMDQGFTEEQALKIVTSTTVPNPGGKS